MQLSENNIVRASSLRESGSFSVITNFDHSATTDQTDKDYETNANTASVVIYETGLVEPRVIAIPFNTPTEYVGAICATVHTQLETFSQNIPYSIIKELVDNFIHADYRSPVVSIVEGGRQVVFSDNGPGIQYPKSAIRAGFTTAAPQTKKYIRGVGAGFTIVHEYCQAQGFNLQIDSNLGLGTVVSLCKGKRDTENEYSGGDQKQPLTLDSIIPKRPQITDIPAYALNERQKAVLTVLLSFDDAGPQLVADKLGMGVSTAHRDLKALEMYGLAEKLPNKKSKLTEVGFEYIDYLASH